jgi:nitrate/TMAO reductase-like tetraheme cytochrome c subunit
MNIACRTSGKDYRFKLLVAFIAIFTFVSWHSPIFLHAEESSCVSCHTNLKKLLKITSDIEASKPKVEKPAESKGEG